MATQVTLEVKSLLKQDGQENIYNYQTRGNLYHKGSVTYLQYHEGTEGLEGVRTTLKIENNRVTLIRHGNIDMCQIFQTGYKDQGIYRTPYGNFDMGVETYFLEIALQRDKGNIRILYNLYLAQELNSENTLEITYQSLREDK